MHTIRWMMVMVWLGIMTGCTTQLQPATALSPARGTEWQLTHMNQTVVAPAVVGLLISDTEVSGLGFCNQYRAPIRVFADQVLELDAVSSTRKLCMDDTVMQQERQFFAALSRIQTYTRDEQQLVLYGTDGTELRFEAASTP